MTRPQTIRLHHRLHWPLCLALASLVALVAYIYAAQPPLAAERRVVTQLRHQMLLRQESLALAPLQPLVNKATQPLPAAPAIAATIKKAQADPPLTDLHYDLGKPAPNSSNLRSQRLTLSFHADRMKPVLALIGWLPKALPCHVQLAALKIEGDAVHADFTLVGQ